MFEMKETILNTGRLVLRPWRESDAAALYRYASDPAVGPVAGWPPHTSVEDSLNVIRTVFSAPETYALVLKETGEPVGSAGIMSGDGLHSAEMKPTEAEIGYWIAVPYWGRGLVPEAVRRLLRRCFEDLGKTAVWCGYYDGNVRSRRVMEKCGLRFHHTEEGKLSPLGDIRTEHFMCVRREEFSACSVRPLSENDIDDMRELFRSTVLSVNRKDYTEAETRDWASCGEGSGHWKSLLEENSFEGAFDSCGRLIGFASMDRNGHLHSMFVHRDWQGRGVATLLLRRVENLAREYGAEIIFAEVSITARPFFERRGFRVVREQLARAKELCMTNFVMEKSLRA